jgi:hypothetical protein
MAITLGVKRLPCTGVARFRVRTKGDSSTMAVGRGLVARAPVVRCNVNSPLRVSPGLRPHRRHRCSISLLCDPQ